MGEVFKLENLKVRIIDQANCPIREPRCVRQPSIEVLFAVSPGCFWWVQAFLKGAPVGSLLTSGLSLETQIDLQVPSLPCYTPLTARRSPAAAM